MLVSSIIFVYGFSPGIQVESPVLGVTVDFQLKPRYLECYKTLDLI